MQSTFQSIKNKQTDIKVKESSSISWQEIFSCSWASAAPLLRRMNWQNKMLAVSSIVELQHFAIIGQLAMMRLEISFFRRTKWTGFIRFFCGVRKPSLVFKSIWHWDFSLLHRIPDIEKLKGYHFVDAVDIIDKSSYIYIYSEYMLLTSLFVVYYAMRIAGNSVIRKFR